MAFISNDFKLEDGDFDFSSGDFSVEESSIEHLDAIMESYTGDYIEVPELGTNLSLYLNSPLDISTIDLQSIITRNMKLDNFSTTDLTVVGILPDSTLEIKTSGERLR